MDAITFGLVFGVVNDSELDSPIEVFEQLSCQLFAWRLHAAFDSGNVGRISADDLRQFHQREVAGLSRVSEGLIRHAGEFAGRANLCQALNLRKAL